MSSLRQLPQPSHASMTLASPVFFIRPSHHWQGASRVGTLYCSRHISWTTTKFRRASSRCLRTLSLRSHSHTTEEDLFIGDQRLKTIHKL
ncbi:hypothetical protein VIGAN_10105300 [Vigna angularis var. angularis]|uniref:Uncharacterized protein n=1 Tax=Vigna angularis var. angularis TaxID=157739 RepID=A0A0S3T2Y9_PHAAN|nr:hypothetical protein VIGAN_10105300 [Vigna angularis var. angularis]